MTKAGEEGNQQEPQQGEGHQAQQQAGQQGAAQQNDQGRQAPAINYEKIAEILDGRQKANEDSVLKGYFKQQGLTGDEMAQAIKAFKDAKAAKAPDVDGMSARIDELAGQLVAAKVESAVTQAAVQMGIDAKAMPYLAKMADLGGVVGEDGTVDADKVAAALQKVLEDVPALKPQATAAKGFQVGGAGAGEGSRASADEAAAKLDRAFGIRRKQ